MPFARKNKRMLGEKIFIKNEQVIIVLKSGENIILSIDHYPALKNASKRQLDNYRLIGQGIGFHFPEIDEDISVEISYNLMSQDKKNQLKELNQKISSIIPFLNQKKDHVLHGYLSKVKKKSQEIINSK